MTELNVKGAYKEFDRTCGLFIKALEKYAYALIAAGVASGDPTERGLSGRQVRQRLKVEVVARLSPKAVFGEPDPILQLDGAPEARRHAAAHPLPGAS